MPLLDESASTGAGSSTTTPSVARSMDTALTSTAAAMLAHSMRDPTPSTFNERILRLEEDLQPLGNVVCEQDLETDVDDDDDLELNADGTPVVPVAAGGVQHYYQRAKETSLAWIGENRTGFIYIVLAAMLALVTTVLYFVRPGVVTHKHKGKRQIDWAEFAKWTIGVAIAASAIVLGAFYYGGHLG